VTKSSIRHSTPTLLERAKIVSLSQLTKIALTMILEAYHTVAS
jgi:hypothetical protein